MLQPSSVLPQPSLIDITSTTLAQPDHALDLVGMQGIDLPIQIQTPTTIQHYLAKANIGVNLLNPAARGIHMSRLYQLLNAFSQQPCTSEQLQHLLQQLCNSQQEVWADTVKLTLQFQHAIAKAALLTRDLYGWQSYPITLSASWEKGAFQLWLTIEVQYSSTCPCSAALSRQLLQEKFLADFATEQYIAKSVLASWLGENGSFATPHSQRSVAQIRVEISHLPNLPIEQLILLAEQCLATPVQTAVKRADEQAFAKLNGENLMFVEDAVRRLAHALTPQFPQCDIQVQHLESLHPHDAVASFSQRGDR